MDEGAEPSLRRSWAALIVTVAAAVALIAGVVVVTHTSFRERAAICSLTISKFSYDVKTSKGTYTIKASHFAPVRLDDQVGELGKKLLSSNLPDLADLNVTRWTHNILSASPVGTTASRQQAARDCHGP